MRRLARGTLPKRVVTYLARKQAQVNAGKPARPAWESARKTIALRNVAKELARMTGIRQRCMFCEDSRGNDIDHYRPLAHYPCHCFVWENFLWLCAGCNRHKGDRFDLDAGGLPLLIDPTAEEPWDYLFYDSHTGIITARYDPATGKPHPKGEYTTNSAVLPLNIEAVTDGRQRTQRNLRRAVRHFLQQAQHATDLKTAQTELLEAISDNDGYALARWFFERQGKKEPPFSDLKKNFPSVWKAVLASLR